MSQREIDGGMVGEHPSIRSLLEAIHRAAPTPTSVLLQGPTGSGKELAAQLLHDRSGRRGEIVAVNVATLSEQLADAELFGVERGAYTGATASRPGLIEGAHGGTLFLDEAGDLSLTVQVRLLRALESGSVRRLGSVRDRPTSFRLVVSVQQSPQRLMLDGRWREDFFFRVAGIQLSVPPLRERLSDIPLLVAHFLRQLGCAPFDVPPPAEFYAHSWPGNVRELMRVVERAAFAAENGRVSGEHLAGALESLHRDSQPRIDSSGAGSLSLVEVEEEHIRRVLQAHGNHVELAARVLGLSARSLYRRLQRLGIRPERVQTKAVAGA